jgi:hypothetical protein
MLASRSTAGLLVNATLFPQLLAWKKTQNPLHVAMRRRQAE